MQRSIIAALLVIASITAHSQSAPCVSNVAQGGHRMCDGDNTQEGMNRLIAADTKIKADGAKMVQETPVIDPYHTSAAKRKKLASYGQTGETVKILRYDQNGSALN